MFNVQVHMKENYELSLANLDSVVVSLHEQPNSLEGRHEFTNDVPIPDIRLAVRVPDMSDIRSMCSYIGLEYKEARNSFFGKRKCAVVCSCLQLFTVVYCCLQFFTVVYYEDQNMSFVKSLKIYFSTKILCYR